MITSNRNSYSVMVTTQLHSMILFYTIHDIFSVTECEVDAGILNANQPRDHVVCYIRKLSRLQESNLTETNATRFIDSLSEVEFYL